MGNRSKQQRRLSDLYVVGTPVKVTGRHGDTLVWMQKLDPVDHDACVRKAKAARAAARAIYKDESSEEYLEVVDTVETVTREALVEQIIAPEVERLKESIRSELMMGEDTEWAKDDYLAGLYDEWASTLSARYDDDPDDADALRVLAEFERFEKEFEEARKPQEAQFREMWAATPEQQLHEKAIESLIERRLQERWIEEFVRCELWLSTREPCKLCETEIAEALRRRDAGEPPEDPKNLHQDLHSTYYFKDRVEVDRLEPIIREHLETVYLQLSVDPIEGKDLPETGASSGSFDLSATEATPASSGPAAATA